MAVFFSKNSALKQQEIIIIIIILTFHIVVTVWRVTVVCEIIDNNPDCNRQLAKLTSLLTSCQLRIWVQRKRKVEHIRTS